MSDLFGFDNDGHLPEEEEEDVFLLLMDDNKEKLITQKEKRTLTKLYPNLAAEWHSTLNGTLTPNDVSNTSKKKCYWICKRGHQYQASPYARSIQGTGCPYCSNKKALKGYNDLASICPDLLLDWDYDNNNVTPTAVVPGTGSMLWWKCHVCGGRWKAKGADRYHGSGCPYCSNKKVLEGYNDLATTNKELAREWNYEKNIHLLPNMVVEGSKQRVWWKCNICGAEWQATVSDRHFGRGCPSCYKRKQTSFPEQSIFYYISKKYPDARNGYRGLFNSTMELDIYIPSIQTAIEYDGIAWHSSSKALRREIKKYSRCKELGIRLIRIRESTKQDTTKTCDIALPALPSLDDTILQLGQFIELPEINTERDRVTITRNYYSIIKHGALSEVRPDLAAEWDYKCNGGITPEMVLPNSNDKMWWICSLGHHYQSSVAHRNDGKGCPYCAGQKVLKGFNDLEFKCPDLAAEWDYDKNLPLTPDQICAKSNKKVWWKCNQGHSWAAAPLNRQGHGCPFCSGNRALTGFNDFASFHPTLLDEWDYNKNIDISPASVSEGSNKKVWWKCKECGAEWQATIYSRAIQGTNCPKCSKRKGALKRTSKVRCIETNTVYESITQASVKTGIWRDGISKCLKGVKESVKGFHWKYEES